MLVADIDLDVNRNWHRFLAVGSYTNSKIFAAGDLLPAANDRLTPVGTKHALLPN